MRIKSVSASQHMRDSRANQRINEHSHEKRPGWNSKTKVENSPVGAKGTLKHK